MCFLWAQRGAGDPKVVAVSIPKRSQKWGKHASQLSATDYYGVCCHIHELAKARSLRKCGNLISSLFMVTKTYEASHRVLCYRSLCCRSLLEEILSLLKEELLQLTEEKSASDTYISKNGALICQSLDSSIR